MQKIFRILQKLENESQEIIKKLLEVPFLEYKAKPTREQIEAIKESISESNAKTEIIACEDGIGRTDEYNILHGKMCGVNLAKKIILNAMNEVEGDTITCRAVGKINAGDLVAFEGCDSFKFVKMYKYGDEEVEIYSDPEKQEYFAEYDEIEYSNSELMELENDLEYAVIYKAKREGKIKDDDEKVYSSIV